MSEMEYNEGILTFVSDDVASFAKEYVEKEQIVLPKCYDDAVEWFESNCRDTGHMIINDKLYKAEFKYERAEVPPEAIDVTEGDVMISFATYHYNGGGSLEEVIEGELKRKGEDNV